MRNQADAESHVVKKWVTATHHTYRTEIEVPEGFRVCPYPECDHGRIPGDPMENPRTYACHVCRGNGVVSAEARLCPVCHGHLSIYHAEPCPTCGNRHGWTQLCKCDHGLIWGDIP